MSEPDVTVEMLTRLDRPLPRYTSYPTAPSWGDMGPQDYGEALRRFDQEPRPLSLYLHIPFCRSMCLYCGCSVVLNRRPENEERYVEYLLREVDLVADRLQAVHPVGQVHLGGGTPTQLSEALMERLVLRLRERFPFAADAEVAIEIDPRTVWEDSGSKLRHLKHLGFNRVSFGVQDTDPRVQEAVKRRQSYEMTRDTYLLARALEFQGVNVDLIYGLPHQTVATFTETVQKITALRPCRIALFSYARVPWLKPHQKAIPEEALPTTAEKFAIYVLARNYSLDNGYVGIGMDHFALEEDEIAQAYRKGQLHRNFQGYTVRRSQDMIGLGITAVGDIGGGYFQNVKELSQYYAALDRGELPTARGLLLQPQDVLRRWVIQQLMCHFTLDKQLFAQRYGQPFDDYFSIEYAALRELEQQGLVLNSSSHLSVTQIGRLFVRHVAAAFDAYLSKPGERRFSQVV